MLMVLHVYQAKVRFSIKFHFSLLYQLKFLPHLTVEQIYYLNCLLNVIQKLSAQTWYIESYIVKYGPSTGAFIEKLIKRSNLKTIILLAENNKEFYLLFKAKFKEEGNLLFVYRLVVKIEQYIKIIISIMFILVFRLQVYNKEKLEMFHLFMLLVVQYEKNVEE
jgi:hypothetical protein